MRIRLVLGAAGSGKTFRCLAEAKRELVRSPEGAPLLIIAPKQGTYQLEQQLLADSSLAGYTRLRILSFDSLARDLLTRFGKPPLRLLDEEGRLMVLRNLLSKNRNSLRVFRASARLTGFAQQLSLVLKEFQRHQTSPAMIAQFASEVGDGQSLSAKLRDLVMLQSAYLNWLETNQLQDADALLGMAVDALHSTAPGVIASHVWIDGFAEFSSQELDFLAALLPHCSEATITFCLDPAAQQTSWLSHWTLVGQSFEQCRKRLATLPDAQILLEILKPAPGRFAGNPVLDHLATRWSDRLPFSSSAPESIAVGRHLRVAVCRDPEAEARIAAREILRYVQAGGRYRAISVIVRSLDIYHTILQRVFTRYEIPFFIDRRESVTHHPLAQLTRSALRTVAFGWQHEDWFAALKSGLAPASDKDVDFLENEALARGWRGAAWLNPIQFKERARTEADREWVRQTEERLERLRNELVAPFERLSRSISSHDKGISGSQLAEALRAFWEALKVGQRLGHWAEGQTSHGPGDAGASVHETVWNQLNAWLDNAELGFPDATLTLREWLPLLETGLANLTVGIIPPSLDQVLVGAVDRSRTPNVELAIVLGFNESIFPARKPTGGLLNEADRLELERGKLLPGSTARHHLNREQYLAYIACTRASERLVLTCARRDAQGAPLNESSFLSHVRRMFPSLEIESDSTLDDWQASAHVHELVSPILKMSRECSTTGSTLSASDCLRRLLRRMTGDAALPRSDGFRRLFESLKQMRSLDQPELDQRLTPALAERLYGPVLRSSVSRLEQFAACPFKFFVHSGLRAEERKAFELDVKEQGSFQHDVLARFHEQLRAEHKVWRDVTPQEARDKVAGIASELLSSYREGLLETSEQTRFLARVMTESLQDFIETLVGWMREQYQFDPVAVEIPFGVEPVPAWRIDLGAGHALEVYGRIDRVDLHRTQQTAEAPCIVIDYKSSQKQLDSVLVAHGIQLQLLTYLNVLRRWTDPNPLFGAKRLTPAGAFYVSLRGRYERQGNRTEALANSSIARKNAYRHSGRFDARFLKLLDSRGEVRSGDQFNYRLTTSGGINKNSREALTTEQFQRLLDAAEQNIKKMGEEIFRGVTTVTPYRKAAVTACDQCVFEGICRIDPVSAVYRVLKAPA